MFQIIIVPGNTGATAGLYYTSEEAALSAQSLIQSKITDGNGLLVVSDDYGFVLSMDVSALSYALLIDSVKAALLPRADQTPAKRIYAS